MIEGNCSWCGQSEIGEGSVRGHVETHGLGPAKVFCSDICFSQCRRAAFKRAKVCDWCKHVRHTVSYVDLHDGQRQLQFCTDKCRNQYKMHLFCAEASSLGVQSCTTPVSSKGETSPGTSIDLKTQSSGLLITPDLWLADCRLDNPVNVKLECNEETELTSIESEPEEQNCEGPLNLVHSSRRSNHLAIKRKPVDITEIPMSKKGKSHRKMNHFSGSHKTTVHPRSNPIPPTPSIPATAWPSFPYPPHVLHPSLILQSQFLALNHTLKPQKNLDGVNHDPVIPSTIGIEPDKLLCDSVVNQKIPVTTTNLLSPDVETIDSGKMTETNNKTDLPPPVFPQSYVVMRIPYFIPLPIPVPIPIPLNIHEKYLKHVLT